jgi:hypothetical protein
MQMQLGEKIGTSDDFKGHADGTDVGTGPNLKGFA